MNTNTNKRIKKSIKRLSNSYKTIIVEKNLSTLYLIIFALALLFVFPKLVDYVILWVSLILVAIIGLVAYVVINKTNDHISRPLQQRLIEALPDQAFRYVATSRFLAGGWQVIEPKQIEVTEDVIDIEPTPIKTYSFDEAYKQSDKYNWNIGQIEGTDQLATFNFTRQSHVLVCGGTNCGKTSTTGFMLALYALKSKMHVIVFDGANGSDWNEFKPYTEFYDAQPEHLEVIISNIERLYQERQDKLKELNAASNYDLDKPLQPIVIMIDELGYLLEGLKVDKNRYKSVVARFQKMIRVIRKVSIHLVLIDQNANSIPQEILTNIKCIFAYQAEGHIGNAIKRYNLDKLKAQGQFNFQGKIVDGWYTKQHLSNYLPSIKPVKQQLMLTVDRSEAASDVVIDESIVVIEENTKMIAALPTPSRQPTSIQSYNTKPKDTTITKPSPSITLPKAVSNRLEFVNQLIEIAKTEQLNDSKVRKYCKELTGKSLDGNASKVILEYVLSKVQAF